MKGEPFGKSLRKRSWETAKLAARLGFVAATKQLNIDLPQSNEQAISKAIALAEQFDGMKGLMLKFGQMASYLNTSLPPEAQQILAKLQSAGTAMPFSDIRHQIENGLGAPVNQLFEHFETEAFAAASIGQVHKSIYNGQSVAVKVQYPGIRRIIESDLKNVSTLAQIILVGTKMDGAAFAEELRDRLLEECDYLLEAKRQHAIGSLWNKCPGSHVPEVIFPRCGETVFTTQFETGSNFQTYISTANEESRRKSSFIIFKNVFEGIFHHGFFNGDPHPGNYLFREDGSVVFLDFGCVRIFEEEFLTAWKGMAKSILDNNFNKFKEYSYALGVVGNAKKFDWDFQWQLMNYVYEPFKSITPYRYSKAHVDESYTRLLWKNENRRHAVIPPQMLFVNRLQWGLNSILKDLNAEVRYCDIFREAVEAKIERIPGLA